ncbi:MAG: hypothetical protein PHQ27_03270 [Victivallales bacterium]|nr:hypothetical protein [Victivallales bacterium]
MGKYTIADHPELDAVIDAALPRIVAAALATPHGHTIAAIVLGGGYGRADGGAYRDAVGHYRPYNDFDLFVFTQGRSRRSRRRLDAELAAAMTEPARALGIHVDFGPAQNLSLLPRTPFTMMWQELKQGHMVVYGAPDVLAAMPEYDLKRMPLEEGAKLLLNRGTGLWLARTELAAGLSTPAATDFTARNLWKAVLACGDAALIARNAYEPTLAARLARLRELATTEPELNPTAQWYLQAATFKQQPRDYTPEEIGVLWEPARQLFHDAYLDFFRRFYRRPIADMAALQDLVFREEPPDCHPTPIARGRNMVLNLLTAGITRFNWRHYQRYPRFILFTVFPGLLFDSGSQKRYIVLLPGIKPDSSPEAVATAYRKLWLRFN